MYIFFIFALFNQKFNYPLFGLHSLGEITIF